MFHYPGKQPKGNSPYPIRFRHEKRSPRLVLPRAGVGSPRLVLPRASVVSPLLSGRPVWSPLALVSGRPGWSPRASWYAGGMVYVRHGCSSRAMVWV